MAEMQKTNRSDFIRRPSSEIAGLSSRTHTHPHKVRWPEWWALKDGANHAGVAADPEQEAHRLIPAVFSLDERPAAR